jgi:hypothetical protein
MRRLSEISWTCRALTIRAADAPGLTFSTLSRFDLRGLV